MSIFSSIRTPRIKKTAFDLSFENKLSCNMGQLVPVFCKEVLPGDKWRAQTTTLIRFSPLRSPIMQSIDAYVHYFFVPNRLLMPQKDWETFITGGKTGEETAQLPYMTLDDLVATNGEVGSLADYLGYPVNQNYIAGSGVQNIDLEGNSLRVSTLPLRAYQLIWQEYYRDQNLTDEIFDFQNALPNDGGVQETYELIDLLTLRNRCWKKDYFTSALPFVQRGQPATLNTSLTFDELNIPSSSFVSAPFQNRLWVSLNGGSQPSDWMSYDDAVAYAQTRIPSTAHGFKIEGSDITALGGSERLSLRYSYYETDGSEERTYSNLPLYYRSADTHGHVVQDATAQLSNPITINDIRRAESLQQWLERNARGGARYIEQILSHFGVVSSDARLQRPEYLGGGRQPINVSEVLQTSQTQMEDGEVKGTPQGNMAGHAISAGQTISFKRKFEEHGFIIGIMSVMPHASYSQGCPKSLTRFDKLDYAFPEFAHLGEQPIKVRELYLNGTDQGSDDFGYQSVYADYKFSNDEVHGDFKTNLNYWHMGRIFANKPSLNASFVIANPTHRIFAVENPEVQKLWCELYHNVQAVRPLPKYGTPMMSI